MELAFLPEHPIYTATIRIAQIIRTEDFIIPQ